MTPSPLYQEKRSSSDARAPPSLQKAFLHVIFYWPLPTQRPGQVGRILITRILITPIYYILVIIIIDEASQGSRLITLGK